VDCAERIRNALGIEREAVGVKSLMIPLQSSRLRVDIAYVMVFFRLLVAK
jgi:hypothetical protein